MASRTPPLKPQSTTLWEYPSQHYGGAIQGDREYKGATPSWIIWNLLQRYTREDDVVVDPMCGSGTTLDVCKDLGRNAFGFDLSPTRDDIELADARDLPLDGDTADFVFIDPPYSTHLDYSDDPRCIGKLDAKTPAYYEAMDEVFAEAFRILRSRRMIAVYCCDSRANKGAFCAIGFEMYALLLQYFRPVDVVCVVRHNAKLKRRSYHTTAIKGNSYLRGFNYLLIMKKQVD